MKKIEAIVRHSMVEEVKDSLVKAGFHGMTVSEVRGFGRQKGQTETYRGAEYRIDFVPKMLLTVVTTDANAPKIIELIIQTARTGQIGDGKIFVSDLAEVVRIRTGEHGNEAL